MSDATDNITIIGSGVINSIWLTPAVNTAVYKGQFFLVTHNVTCTGGTCGYLRVTLDPKGNVSTTPGDVPFYTSGSNPQNAGTTSCLRDMDAGDSCIVEWEVNSTGDLGAYNFTSLYASSNESIIRGESSAIIISVLNVSNKGAISMVSGAIPFYTTNHTNPLNGTNTPCLEYMYEGDSCVVEWWVNSTGDPETFEFFTIYESLNFTGKDGVSESLFFTIQDIDVMLSTWDDTDPAGGSNVKYLNEQVGFYANYSDLNGTALEGANCSIVFNDTLIWQEMSWNASSGLYQYNRSFQTNGTYELNTTCQKTGYATLTLQDTVPIERLGNLFIQPEDTGVATTYKFVGYVNGKLVHMDRYFYMQDIDIVDNLTDDLRAEFSGDFVNGNVNVSNLKVNITPTKTLIFFGDTQGVSPTHTIYVPITLATGAIVCPNATTLDEIAEGCPGYTFITYDDMSLGVTREIDGLMVNASIVSGSYKLAGLRTTGVAESGPFTLRIWDETETDGSMYSGQIRYGNDSVVFFANFTNMSGMPANTSDGGCVIDFAAPAYDGYESMTFNNSILLYTFNRSFSDDGTYNWSVNCTGQGVNLQTTDSVLIRAISVPGVPEFGTWALLAALGIVIAGVVMRRRA